MATTQGQMGHGTAIRRQNKWNLCKWNLQRRDVLMIPVMMMKMIKTMYL